MKMTSGELTLREPRFHEQQPETNLISSQNFKRLNKQDYGLQL